MSRALCWFRRDLRLEGNPAFAAATGHDEVVALWVHEPWMLEAAGPRRAALALAHVRALDAALRERGGRLRVEVGDPVEVVPAVAAGCDATYWCDDTTPYALRRDDAVRAALGGAPVSTWWGGLVQPPGSVRTTSGTLSQVFTPFYKVWRRTPLDPWPEPGAGRVLGGAGGGRLPDLGPPVHPAGEAAAEERLAAFCERVDGYAERRDAPADHGTSGLSSDLRFGTLSARHVVEVVGTSTPGREAFVRQLAWRDWYAHLFVARPELARRPMKAAYEAIAWEGGDDAFEAWAAGRTGVPFVDAGMRQLAEAGWMHNRVRMVVASFLVKNLLVDWRRGERWFRRHLIDGEVPQNAGNWQWVAGTGPDAAPYFRVMNPVSQGRRHDPDGEYVRRWVPELAGLAGGSVHAPWELGPLELAAAGVELGATYPEPIVDLGASRERAIATYRAAR